MLDSMGAGGRDMILGSLVGLSFIVNVSVESGIQPTLGNAANGLSAQQKGAVMLPFVRTATECVLRTVAADPKIRASLEAADVRDLIVASMPSCADPMRTMIEAHDRLYGDGSRDASF